MNLGEDLVALGEDSDHEEEDQQPADGVSGLTEERRDSLSKEKHPGKKRKFRFVTEPMIYKHTASNHLNFMWSKVLSCFIFSDLQH